MRSVLALFFGLFLLIPVVSPASEKEGMPEYVKPYAFYGRPYYDPYVKPYKYLGPGRQKQDVDPQEVKEVKIGLVGPLSGPGAAYGLSMQKGAQMAMDEINAQGGYQGKPLVMISRDDKASMKEHARHMVNLMFDEKVWAIIGSVDSGSTHVGERLILKGEVVQITSVSTDPSITRTGIPWIFRCLADDVAQGRALSELVFKKKGHKKVALVEHNNRYGRKGGEEIKKISTRLGHPMSLLLKFEGTDTDFSSQIKRIKYADVDAVIIWGLYKPSALFTKQLREAGLTMPVYGSDGIVSPAYIDIAGPAAEGVVVTYPFDSFDPDPLTQKFLANYKEKYGEEADSFVAHAYDAMYMLYRAINLGGLNRARIRDALATTKNFHGVTGEISFNHMQNDIRPVIFAQIKGGKFVPYEE